VLLVLTGWLWYVQDLDILSIMKEQLGVIITMFFGAFIAGSSPEGSASIAYPIFTLYLKIAPATARNFGFAIQSFGMTAASIYILSKRIAVDWKYIFYVSLGGIAGLFFGTYYIVPLVNPPVAKMLFVSLWLSFGIVLFIQNRNASRTTYDTLIGLTMKDFLLLIAFGIIGGVISSLFGTGINIFTFCLMVVYYHINEKVATASSIIIMTIETILGFILHRKILNDFGEDSFRMWIACIPLVIFMAPLGSWVLSKISRLQLARLLYFILFVQFCGALWVIRPGVRLSMMSLAVIGGGILLFRYLSGLKRRDQIV
jgi:uncharacterized membrane protein YfcA